VIFQTFRPAHSVGWKLSEPGRKRDWKTSPSPSLSLSTPPAPALHALDAAMDVETAVALVHQKRTKCRGRPSTAARPGNATGIQFLADGLDALASEVVSEDRAHDLGLGLVEHGDRVFARRVSAPLQLIPIASSTGDPAHSNPLA
jgi:hypothetical protein